MVKDETSMCIYEKSQYSHNSNTWAVDFSKIKEEKDSEWLDDRW